MWMRDGNVPGPAAVCLAANVQDLNVMAILEWGDNRAGQESASIELFLCLHMPSRWLDLLKRLSLTLSTSDLLLLLNIIAIIDKA